MKRGIITIFFLYFFLPSFSQDDVIITRACVFEGDTIPFIELSPVTIFAPMEFRNKRQQRKYTKLVRNVKKVYPYAKLAGIKFEEYNEILAGIETEKEKKKIMKQLEQELKDEFEEDLKNLTFSQGKILIKLVDRETGNSSYHIVKDLRGAFVAFFWQSLARLFGYNLKIKYDPEGDDARIESIVRRIEAGYL